MLKIENKVTLDKQTIKATNLTDRFESTDLTNIGTWVFEGYTQDKQSRNKWEKRTEAAMDLATQLQKAKNFPWANCSNVAFPLVTIGAMQFHARAYPTIIQGSDVVKMRVPGPDPTGTKKQMAQRVSAHMSYQVLEEDKAWEEQHDRGLLLLAIVGTIFFKTYWNSNVRHNVSELVSAKDLVLDYFAKSVEDCPRKTHVVEVSRNEIRERVLSKVYRDVLKEAWYMDPSQIEPTMQDTRADQRKGETPQYTADETTPFRVLEQHCLLDLDGDGYAEPYIVSIEEKSQAVLRIVSRIADEADITRVESGKYKGEILSIRAEEYFTSYVFIPSPDGGIYGIGFGTLLGPLNESVNSIVNQLIDAGTMANTAGGFLGRGAKIRGGVYSFAPFSWNRVDATGDDLRKSLFPLPVREPSAVLFQLLGMLINYTNRISGATDTIVGENPGQNTPAETTRTMVEMGMKIYNAIFKRVWRSMKEEFKKLYILNGQYLSDKTTFGEKGQEIGREDYLDDSNAIVPEADPNITSDSQAIQRAMTVRQLATSASGYNRDEVERTALKAMRIDNIDDIFPGSGSQQATPSPQDPKIVVTQMKLEADNKRLQLDTMRLMLDKYKIAEDLFDSHRKIDAEIIALQAQAAKDMATADGVAAGHQLEALNVTLGALKHHKDNILNTAMAIMEDIRGHKQLDNDRAMASVENRSSDASSASMGAGAA